MDCYAFFVLNPSRELKSAYRKDMPISILLGDRDSNPDTMLQRHVSYH